MSPQSIEKFNEGTLVEVVWSDSGQSRQIGWESVISLKKMIKSKNDLSVKTIGYYVGYADYEEVIIVAQSYDEHNGNYMNAQAIFLPCVETITKLGA